MFGVHIISGQQFLENALLSARLPNITVTTSLNTSNQADVIIEDSHAAYILTSKQDKITYSKPARVINILQAILTAYNDFAIHFANLVLTPSTSLLRNMEGDNLTLTANELKLLLTLLNAKGQSITGEDLIEKVMGYNAEAETNALETTIYRLRQKLALLSPEQIVSTTEKGYAILLDHINSH